MLPNRFFMLNFNTIIQNEYESAYGNAYDLSLKRQFSKPKIYNAKGDLTKRWYVYFSYRDPKSGKLTRQTPFYGNANTYKTKEERFAVLTIYRNIIYKYLNEGYGPYKDNSEIKFKDVEESQDSSLRLEGLEAVKPTETVPNTDEDSQNLIKVENAFESVLKIKQRELRVSSLRSFKSHLKIFREWLKNECPEIIHVHEIDRSSVNSFLNTIQVETSARNRNNYRATLSSAFESLYDNEIVPLNIVKQIKKLKTKPTRHIRYSEEQQQAIFSFLKKEDPLILLYIKFIAYSFMRPLEVCRLKIGDIDKEKKIVSFMPKNGSLKTKIIPDILLKEIPDLSKMNKQAYLFTAEGIGKFTETKLENRRSYFTARFNKITKERFALGLEHTM